MSKFVSPVTGSIVGLLLRFNLLTSIGAKVFAKIKIINKL